MRLLSILFAAFLANVSAGHYFLDRFEDWARKFGVKFLNDFHREDLYRKWVDNDKFIETHNAKNLSFTLGHNQFSGMDQADYKKYLGLSGIQIHINNDFVDEDAVEPMLTSSMVGIATPVYANRTTFLRTATLPTSVDWVAKGAVTTPKDQGQCGSCWSFSTTGALEGAYAIKYSNLVSFSEQQLVDCDNLKNGGKDHGCNGGLMDNAFNWIHNNGGLCTEAAYPYVSGTTQTAGTCQKQCSLVANSKIAKYVDVTPKSDTAMMTAIASQPVSIAIEADQREFQLYKSGVFSATCGTQLDHGVLTVGYGTQNGQDYYKVKNSWGTTWGDAGYILLGRGTQYNNGAGQCGMLMQPSYPVL